VCLLKMNQTRFSIDTRCRSISSLPDSIEQGGYAISHRSISFFFEGVFTSVHVAHRNPDAYHTSYCLSGLSAAQHHVYPSPTRREEVRAAWKGEDGMRATAFSEALCWTEESGGSHIVGSAANRVVCHHS
jgi:hypothetical protein